MFLKSCGAGKFPFWFSSAPAPLSFAFDSVNELSSVTSAPIRHSYFPWNASYRDFPPLKT